MKDLIEKILAYLPQYLGDFWSLCSGPKRFMAQKNTVAEDSLDESLIFLGVSLVLIVVLTSARRPPNTELWSYVGQTGAVVLASVGLGAIGLRLAWRLVGGKTTVRSFFITYAYFYSVTIVGLTFFQAFAVGVYKAFAGPLYDQVIDAQQHDLPIPESDSIVPFVADSLFYAGYIFLSLWGFVAWGAYRELNGLSKSRSFFAFMIMGVLSLVITFVVAMLSKGIMAST